MNILIIFVLLFTFTHAEVTSTKLPLNGSSATDTTQDTRISTNSSNNFTGSLPTSMTSTKLPLNDSSATDTALSTNSSNNFTGSLPTSKTPKSCNTSEGASGGKITNKSKEEKENQGKKESQSHFKLDLKTVVTFLLGMTCSAILFSTVLCLVSTCNRCQATDANKDKESIVLEAVKSGHDQSDEDQADEQTPLQGKEGAREVNEVAYASIDYSRLQKTDDGDIRPQKVETDYAEIQIKKPSDGEEAMQNGVDRDGVEQDGVEQDGVDQDGVKQDGVDLEEGMDSQNQVALEQG